MSTPHEPFVDDGVTYCGVATDGGIVDGCGELWPCTHERARRRADAAPPLSADLRARLLVLLQLPTTKGLTT